MASVRLGATAVAAASAKGHSADGGIMALRKSKTELSISMTKKKNRVEGRDAVGGVGSATARESVSSPATPGDVSEIQAGSGTEQSNCVLM